MKEALTNRATGAEIANRLNKNYQLVRRHATRELTPFFVRILSGPISQFEESFVLIFYFRCEWKVRDLAWNITLIYIKKQLPIKLGDVILFTKKAR